MSEFEERLQKILSSPEDMERIIGIARTIAASAGSSGAGAQQESTEAPSGPSTPSGGPDVDSLTAMIGNIDPSMFRLLTRVLGAMNSGGHDKAELFNSIKPYLREDRRQKIDKALSIAKVARLARAALSELSEGGL